VVLRASVSIEGESGDASMNHLSRVERERRDENWDVSSEFIYRLDKGPYYFQETATRWVPYTESETKAKLLREDFVDYLHISHREQPVVVGAEINGFLAYVSSINRVDYAGPVAGRKAGVREFNGTKILVTRDPMLVTPEVGDWSGLRQIFERMFGPDQIDYYYSWQKRVLQSVLSGNAISIHFFAMCGPVNCGKTWLQEAVISEMLGGYACPNQYMSEGTPFNADLFRTPHQMLSDAKGSISFEKRRTFGSFVKDIVANTGHRCHGKGEKAIELDPIWVATCSCNTSPIDRLRILPPLDDDIRDKMIITLINPGRMPIDTAEPEGKEEFRVWTKQQLPAFAWWLLNEYTIPTDIALPDRFGIKGYCHPEIERHLLELSPDARVRDYIHDTLFGRGQNQAWRGTYEELRKKLNTEEGRKLLRSVKGRLADVLSRLQRVYPKEFKRKKNDGQRFLVIEPPALA
jgi:hypothetical protein